MKKYTTVAALFFCILVLVAPLFGQQTSTLPAMKPGFSFPQRQTLSYAVDWRVFPAGTATVRFDAVGDRERISATADTVGALNMLFRVSDKFQSSFDRSRGCSYELDKQTVEGRRQINSTLRVDYGSQKSILDEKNLVNGQSKHIEQPLSSGCLTDLLSGIFFAASQPMEIGQSFTIPVVDATHTVPVTMKVEGREAVKTPLGIFKTLRVQPTADAGVVKNRGNIWIWYTDDDRHLPVQMRARGFWGTITFQLSAMDPR